MLAVGKHALGDLGPRGARIATGLAGGVGNSQQEMCGALSSGVLIIGALFGRERLDEDEQPALDLAACYRERFLAQFGATQCAQLRQIVQSPGSLGSCALVVEQAALILLRLLAEAE